MLPPVFRLLADSVAVKALVGTSPVRVYRHGHAPQNTTAPYCTWSVVFGDPELLLNGSPSCDRYTVQVDCWSENTGNGSAQVEALASAVRDALELGGHVTGVVADTVDPVTGRFRIGLQADLWVER